MPFMELANIIETGKIRPAMKCQLLLLLSLFTLPLCAQSQPPTEAKQKQAHHTSMSDEDFLCFMTRLLIPSKGFEQQYHDTEDALQAVQAAAEAFLPAAKEAYLAQMEWAQHSVSILMEDSPQSCSQALEIYRCELQQVWLRDLSWLYENCLYPFSEPEQPVPFNKQEPLEHPAMTDSGIFELWEERVGSCNSSSAVYRAQARLGLDINTRRAQIMADFIRQALAADDETADHPYIMFDHEFLTCKSISSSPSLRELSPDILDERMERYRHKLVNLFNHAEEKWLTYIEQAANLYCPVAIDRGSCTILEEARLINRLVIHHDMWLQRLLRPIREK